MRQFENLNKYNNEKYIKWGSLHATDNYLKVFSCYKQGKGGYSKSGTIHYILLNSFTGYKLGIPIFNGENQGLMPYFENNTLNYFRSDGYFHCTEEEVIANDSSVSNEIYYNHKREKVDHDYYNAVYIEHIKRRSMGILNGLESTLNTREASIGNGKFIFLKLEEHLRQKNFFNKNAYG